MKKVLFIPATTHASNYYRMTQPSNLLRKLGYDIDSAFFNTVDPRDLSAMSTYTNNKINLKDYDITTFQMVWHQALNSVINQLNDLGKFTCMEVDDNYDCLPANNPAFYSFYKRGMLIQDDEGNRAIRVQQQQFRPTHTSKGRTYVRVKKLEPVINPALDNLKYAMRHVKMLQVSTPELKETYLRYNDNITVLENCVDISLYNGITKKENNIPVVGWYGTKTHADDLRILDGMIPDNCKLVLIGVDDLVEKEKLFRGVKNLELLPPFGSIEKLPEAIKDIDIGLCPLEFNQFNEGKSELKAIEFNAGSIPVIATDIAPYRRYVVHGENGFLVSKNKTKFWIRYLNQLINDKGLREQMSKEAKRHAQTRDINKTIERWIETYFKQKGTK